jgi:hypothetical protein
VGPEGSEPSGENVERMSSRREGQSVM